MKVIKRDGRAVDYHKEKIFIAIEKANQEVRDKERATKEEIEEIIKYIEELNKKRMLVEDIQDIIEEQLMERKRFELAKKYIVYRYTRALVRKQNTTDESILGLIRNINKEQLKENANKNVILASTQRNYIAGEVSKDLTNRLLLPDKIVQAHQNGVLYFYNADYFVQPIFNCSLINISDMLDNGTVINGKMIETPQSFLVACNIVVEIIANISSNQYGGQSIDIKCLGKYLRKSYERIEKEINEKYKSKISKDVITEIINNRINEELKTGIKTIQYQLNTIITSNGQLPAITFFLHLDENDSYIKENAIIFEELLKQRYEGIKDENGEYITPSVPRLVYVLDKNNCLKGGEYDYLTKQAIKCSAKRIYPNYISAKKMKELYEGNVFCPMGGTNFLSPWKDEDENYKFDGRFNQGIVSINLPQIAIIAGGDEELFWKFLDERLELCKEALMCRHYALLGTKSDISPIHWQYGAISRLKSGEKIDKLLYDGYSTMSLGYIGIYEMTKQIKGVSHTDSNGKEFALKVMNYLAETISKWSKESNIKFLLYEVQEEDVCKKFAEIDKEKFGKIKDVTDKEYYTNAYHINDEDKMDILSKLKFESEFQKLSIGGAISYIEISNIKENFNELENLVKFIYDNIQYAEFIKNDEIIH